MTSGPVDEVPPNTFVFEPAQARQEDLERGVFVLWRDVADGTRREGLVALASACTNPDCPCGEVVLFLLAVHDQHYGVVPDDAPLLVSRLGDEGPTEGKTAVAHALMHVETGALSLLEDDGGEAEDSASPAKDLLAWLEEELDDALTGRILQAWKLDAARMAESYRALDWSHWSPGQLVAFGEVFPGTAAFALENHGSTYLLTDYHCVSSDCACHNVVFALRELVDDEPGPDLGSVVFDLEANKVARYEPDSLRRSELVALWGSVTAKPRAKELFDQLNPRRTRLKAIGRFLHEEYRARRAPVTSTKIPRNAPCPCGSGKKHKQCCGR